MSPYWNKTIWGFEMGLLALDQAAFSKPGGEQAKARRNANPIDLAHLGEQVMHDASLEVEVLSLFATQVTTLVDNLKSASVRERQLLAHSLSGSAKGIGAFYLAELAEAVETAPMDEALTAPLEDECIRTTDFIAGLNR